MFDNLLQLAADEDKATLTSMATKYPTLKNYFELGEKAEPIRGRLKALGYENDFEKPVKELEDWRGFREKAWKEWQTEHTRVESALVEATAKVAELEANRGTDMTGEEVEAIVTATLEKVGIVDKATLDTTLASFKKEQVDPTVERTVNGLTNRFEKVYQSLTPKALQHQRNFNEDLDYEKVFEHMKVMAEDRFKKTGIRQDIDPLEAYNDLYAAKFTEKNNAQTAAEKQAEYDKGLAEGKKLAAKEIGAQRSPVDGGDSGGGRRPGALMRRAEARMPKKADGDIDTSKIPLGKGIARVATQEYYDKKAGAGA